MPIVGNRSATYSALPSLYTGANGNRAAPEPSTPVSKSRVITPPETAAGGSGPPALVGNATGNDGITAATTTVSVTVRADAAVGDLALVVIENNVNTTTISTAPSGWTLEASGPQDNTVSNTWLYSKTLAAGEPGSSVTWTFSASTRPVAVMTVFTGVTATGMTVATPNTDTSSVSSLTVPTIASVPAGAAVVALFGHARSATTGTPADVTVTSPYSQGTSERAATAFAAGANASAEVAYQIAGGAGSYGGETLSITGGTTRGTTYLVALPAVAAGGGSTPIDVTDTGSGTDDVTVTAAIPLTDAGAGADALTVAATAPLTESGTGADAVTVRAAVPVTDSGTGADALTVAAAVALTDTGTTTDALTVTVAVPVTDAGTAADAVTVKAAVPLTDTGTATDTVTTPSTPIAVTDTGAATDAVTVRAAVPVTDTATGADPLTVRAAVGLTDAASGADALTVAAKVNLTDSGTTADALTVAVRVPLTEAATAVDAITTDTGGVDYRPHTYTAITLADDGRRALTLADDQSAAMTLAASEALAFTLDGDGISRLELATNGASALAIVDDGAAAWVLAELATALAVQTT